MAFTDTWDANFKDDPANSENRSLGAQRIRETRRAVEERLLIDHSLAGDADDGKHTVVTLIQQGADPVPAGTNSSIFAKDSGSGEEDLYFKNDGGELTQITDAGALFDTPTLSAGGSFAGNLILENLIELRGEDGGAVERTIAKYTDKVVLGDTSQNLTAQGLNMAMVAGGTLALTSVGALTLNGNAPATITSNIFMTTPTSQGLIQLSNGLLICYGGHNYTNASNPQSVTLPGTYDSTSYSLMVMHSNTAQNVQYTANILGTGTFELRANDNALMFWITIGESA